MNNRHTDWPLTSRDGTLNADPIRLVRQTKMNENPGLDPAIENFPRLPGDGFVRMHVVLGLYPVSGVQIWKMVKAGTFPAPMKISERNIAWRVSELREFLAADKPAANVGVNPVKGGQPK